MSTFAHTDAFLLMSVVNVNRMAASFGSGATFALLSPAPGANPVVNAITTGMSFAVVQGVFNKVGTVFAPKKAEDDPLFADTHSLLLSLGLERYEKNFRVRKRKSTK